jgi:superoxide reductase
VITKLKKIITMPHIFSPNDFSNTEKSEVQKDYIDRHTPILICPDETEEGKPVKVKIRIGNEYSHPDEGDHFISLIQLWNRESLLAEARYYPGAMGNQRGNIEVEFTIIPKVSMQLTALSYCTKHGFWQSIPVSLKVIHQNSNCDN